MRIFDTFVILYEHRWYVDLSCINTKVNCIQAIFKRRQWCKRFETINECNKVTAELKQHKSVVFHVCCCCCCLWCQFYKLEYFNYYARVGNMHLSPTRFDRSIINLVNVSSFIVRRWNSTSQCISIHISSNYLFLFSKLFFLHLRLFFESLLPVVLIFFFLILFPASKHEQSTRSRSLVTISWKVAYFPLYSIRYIHDGSETSCRWVWLFRKQWTLQTTDNTLWASLC